jgi:hypothetical protein
MYFSEGFRGSQWEGGAAFHQSGFSSKQLFIEAAFH